MLYCGNSCVKSNTFTSGSTDKATPYIALTAPSTKPKSVCNTNKLLIICYPQINFQNQKTTSLYNIRTWLNIRVTTLFRYLLTQITSSSTQMFGTFLILWY